VALPRTAAPSSARQVHRRRADEAAPPKALVGRREELARRAHLLDAAPSMQTAIRSAMRHGLAPGRA
jgi:hypothetical protein